MSLEVEEEELRVLRVCLLEQNKPNSVSSEKTYNQSLCSVREGEKKKNNNVGISLLISLLLLFPVLFLV